MTIAIYGNRHQDDYIADIQRFIRRLVEQGHSIVLHAKLDRYLRDNGCSLPESIVVTDATCTDATLAVSIGGDGTLLRTSQWIADSEMPIIGVNTGHLGFLAPFNLEEAAQAIDDNCVETYHIVDRAMLAIDSQVPLPDDFWPYALNEVAILKRDTASMISVDTFIGDAPLATYLCDGLIVSTPTGSTGYNLSVGGPIVQPGHPGVILSPVAAHSLSMRPLVIDDSSNLCLRVNSRASTFRLSIDGRSVALPVGIDIYVSRAHFSVRTVQKPGYNFFSTLRDKLLWGVSAANK